MTKSQDFKCFITNLDSKKVPQFNYTAAKLKKKLTLTPHLDNDDDDNNGWGLRAYHYRVALPSLFGTLPITIGG